MLECSGNTSLLLQEMDKKYGRLGEGISQLATNIEFLFHAIPTERKKIKGLGFYCSNARIVFPILVVNELSLEFGIANWKLIQWFDDVIKTKNIDSTISIKPLLTITIENLENMMPYINNNDFTFKDFVQFYTEFLNIKKDWRYADYL